MVDLTIGYVAGMVAAGFFIAHQLAPDALAFIISWRLGEKSTAATWTVASTAFSQSHWSYMTVADAVYGNGVSKGVLWAARLIPLSAILFAVGAVVTPLGLYQTVALGTSVQGQFVYTRDTSAFGIGTPSRSNYPFNRLCAGNTLVNAPKPCPFTNQTSVMSTFPNGTIQWDYPNGYNMTVPQITIDTYSSGSVNSTVSNYFDIQWRRYSTHTDKILNDGQKYLIADSSNIEVLLLQNRVIVVEGLIVDMVNGGVGFRNHTVPVGFQHGTEWEEDILFVEPESACVDTNLTIDFSLHDVNSTLFPGGTVSLTDRGGFFNLSKTYRPVNLTDPQGNPDMWGRAYTGAWLHNFYAALYFNVTNPANHSAGIGAFSYVDSEMNKTFQISLGTILDDLADVGLDSITLSTAFGSFIQTNPDPSNPGALNPWNIGSDNFSAISILCSGVGNGDYANISNILVGCGEMRSIPHRVGPGDPTLLEDGSSWSQSLFVCASGVKATVKTVSFSYNGTDGGSFDTLNVTDIRDKTYADESAYPLWGVENVDNTFNISEMNLVWGMVSDEYERNPSVSTVRQRSLYLPGFFDLDSASLGVDGYGTWENLPGSDFAPAGMSAAYGVRSAAQSPDGSSVSSKSQDYSGMNSLAMWVKWQELTNDAQSAALIPNLIFTDAVASVVVGTKGALGQGNQGIAGDYPPILVTPTKQVVRFNYPYGIPAFLGGILLLLILAVAFAATILGEASPARVRRHVQQTSAGRVYTTFLYPGPGMLAMPPGDWSERFGDKVVDLSNEYPTTYQVLVPSAEEKDQEFVTSVQPVNQEQQQQPPPGQPQQQYTYSVQEPYAAVQAYHPGLEQQVSPQYQTVYQYNGGYNAVGTPSPIHTPSFDGQGQQETYHPDPDRTRSGQQGVYQEINTQ